MESAFLPRLLFVCMLLAAAAVAVPKFAPGLMSAFVQGGAGSGAGSAVPAVERPDLGRPPPPPRQQVSAAREFIVREDARGHYVVSATINGRDVPAMVDTGATTVALTAETAHKLGLFPPRSAYTVRISTANGEGLAAEVSLDEIRIGPVAVRNIPAIVVEEGALDIDLLGMTFLSRLERFESSRGRLTLVE